jgi:diketogulonate reductase-like aldo/keto reductase
VLRAQSAAASEVVTQKIPASGEALPVVGLGSWITFNVGNDRAARDSCAEVMRAFFESGGRLIDSSPMYGSSQSVIGEGLARIGRTSAVFAADKVWISSSARGPAQIDESRRLWNVPRFDLLQVHNLLGWEEHLPTLQRMKGSGHVRYVGITTSEGRRHREIEAVMRSQPIDFVQVTYNLVDREVEERILPLARERGIAVIANRPFQEGALLQALQRHPLPPWGGGDRVRRLGAVRAQVRRLASGGDLCDSRHQQRGARAAEPWRCARCDARCRDARAHGSPRGGAVALPFRTCATLR